MNGMVAGLICKPGLVKLLCLKAPLLSLEVMKGNIRRKNIKLVAVLNIFRIFAPSKVIDTHAA